MKKTPDNITDLGAKGTKSCRIAYSLNNDQPVRCSFVSDQPLFYMDFEGDLEEELLAEDYGTMDALDQMAEMSVIQKKIDAAEALSARYDEPNQNHMDDFLADCQFATTPFVKKAESWPQSERLFNTLKQSRLGAAYLELAGQYGTKLQYNDQVLTAHYDRQSGQIYINPYLSTASQILLAARELRRMWQHRNGALLHPLTFHPDQAVLVNRAQIADQAVSMVRIAWELQLAEDKQAWETLEKSSMADLAYAFAREAYLDFRTVNNGIAAGAVFESWFLSERCRHQDRRLIQTMLADYQGYVFDGEALSQSVTAELIGALGSMPYGKNYLALYAGTIIEDPIFTEIRDRSNANFLWFIKFERSFREVEQELQSQEDLAGDTHHQPSQNNKKWLGNNEHEKIITLYGEDSSVASISRTAHNGTGTSGSAQIIAFGDRTGGRT